MQFFMKLSLLSIWCDVDTAIASAGRRDSAEAGNLKIVTPLWNLYWRTLLEKRTSCYCSGVTSLWCIQNTFVSSADVLLLHILVFFWPFSAQCVGVAYFCERTSLSSRPSRCLPKRLERTNPPKRPKWRRKRRSLRWVRVSWWPCPNLWFWHFSFHESDANT